MSSTYINCYGILWRAKSSMGFPRKLSNVSHIRKSFSDRFRAHLAAPTEWVSSQTNKSCLCKSISPHARVRSEPVDYVTINVVLIATSGVSLITQRHTWRHAHGPLAGSHHGLLAFLAYCNLYVSSRLERLPADAISWYLMTLESSRRWVVGPEGRPCQACGTRG